jgi:hypothetical protein
MTNKKGECFYATPFFIGALAPGAYAPLFRAYISESEIDRV